MSVFANRGRGTTQKKQARVGALGAVLFIAIASVLIASKADARPDIRQMSCAQVNSYIQQSGKVVMSITNTRFALFVAGSGYCNNYDERARPAYEATADTPRCQIRYICERRLQLFDRF